MHYCQHCYTFLLNALQASCVCIKLAECKGAHGGGLPCQLAITPFSDGGRMVPNPIAHHSPHSPK